MQHEETKQLSQQNRDEGRLSTAAMRNLFHDVHRMEQSENHLDLEALSSRYMQG